MACLYRVRDFGVTACQYLRPSYFEGSMRHNLAKLALDFLQKYKTLPSDIAVRRGMQDLVDRKVIAKRAS